MSNRHEAFKEYVEKEKNREQLNRALEATPIRDQWRQILVVFLAILVLSGVFFSRTKRFKEVMTNIENSELLSKSRKSKQLQKKGKNVDPVTALANAESKWNEDSYAAGNALASDDLDAHRKARDELGARLEQISNGASRSIASGSSEEGEAREPSQKNTHDLVGIANKTPEPELDAFQIEVAPQASAYNEVTQIPAPYANEPAEFPDL